jgi:tRNA threonylcarbamoyladenosine biosynthesis protein TsaB
MAAESRSVIRGEAAPVPGVPLKDVAIAVEARRDEIYFQLFGDEENRPLTEPLLMSPGRAAALLRSGDTIVAGSGAPRLCEAARKIDLTLSPVLVDEEPDARFLARMTGLQILVPPLPLYLRPPDATPQNGKTLARAI